MPYPFLGYLIESSSRLRKNGMSWHVYREVGGDLKEFS